MSQLSAIMFDFSDGSSAAMARDMLQELGYDPVMHNESRMHIHVDGGDLTSALEIAQAHGGQLVEQAHIAEESITNTAYALNAITIPAHVVNEDWIASEDAANRDSDDTYVNEEFLPDAGEYNHFSGDIHI
ncbi:hypothetical protein RB620_17330 [Paenibacillus sp. LHD-117]|uniref:hypothetical protein n=1 Tax=Paenibacillus sp. LHD-117 TaxID=3071412 RepID=UPI0027E0570C|nr:hypothetical protein [Paenibacillus sp. LHD-117]MDQ6421189.1 hypothetical protein [Paenibacillus sp. LHD-117]